MQRRLQVVRVRGVTSPTQARDRGNRRPGLPDKRRAMLDGAIALFARDGYTRASIDAIAAEAGVSTRTIYNHFGDKAGLFEAVITASSEQVAERHVAIIDRHLTKIVDLEADLVDFGRDLVTSASEDLATHSALVRQINAEIEHIPPAALEAWRATGPLRVRTVLAARLAAIAERHPVRFGDPELAARHLAALISPDNLLDQDADDDAITAMVRAGVRVFLHGYGTDQT